MKRIWNNIIWMGMMVILVVSCSKDIYAQSIDRQKIEHTIRDEQGNDKYTISYYDKAYYDDNTGKLYNEDLEVKCWEADDKGKYEWRTKYDGCAFSCMYTTSDWRSVDNTGGREVSYRIIGMGDYGDLDYTVTYTFYPDSLENNYEVLLESDITVEQPMLIYDGTEQKPVVYVKSISNSNRIDPRFYTVSYENNVNAGKGKVIIKGRDVYSGTLEYSFDIKRVCLREYDTRRFLAGESNKLVENFKEPEYTVNIIDKDRKLAEVILSDSDSGNYYFSVFSTLSGESVECTGVRIENYDEQWGYKWYPAGKLIDEDGGYKDICTEHMMKTISVQYNATCLSEGHGSVYQCKMCGRYYSDENGTHEITHLNDTVTPKLEHAWGDWTLCYPATTSYEGSMERRCALCGSVEYKSIPRLSGGDDSTYTTPTPSQKEDLQKLYSDTGGDDKTSASGSGNDLDSEEDYSDNYVPDVSVVSGFKIAAKKKKQLVITWKKLSDIDGYEIQYGTDKKYKKAKTKKISKTKNTYTIKKLKSRKKYYIRIRGYKKYIDEDGDAHTAYGRWISRNKKCK